MRYEYIYNGKAYAIDLQRQPDGTLNAAVNDKVLQVTASELGLGRWLLFINGERFLVHTGVDKEARYVHLNGTQYRLEKSENNKRRHKTSAGGGGLTAEMPSQVLEVRVAEGDLVSSGQVLVVLEAMKMEIRITAPLDGFVKKIYVAVGDVVERGQKLAELGQD